MGKNSYMMDVLNVGPVGRNKTNQACPEPVEGRSAGWAFPANMDGVCRKRQFSLSLEPAYSGLQGVIKEVSVEN
jgi:hypothetical protein